ncbi:MULTISPECIES: transposase [Microcystis]|uniref:transposase n=1 Tax=Microcystis TaxID=1125 RepID=UPI0020A5501E|nr:MULTISPECIES: transposase [Microcystis]
MVNYGCSHSLDGYAGWRSRKSISEVPICRNFPPQHTVFRKTLHLKPLGQISGFLLGSITLIADLLKGLSIHLHRWSSFPPTLVNAFYHSRSS